ncbi:hypothetical protein PMAYCL1PPCAC_30646 [Pristionchus mayeri]|uniref:C2H2-type domain-containing protein n=1 Tax=Pristionchus mayeri TaxID=1317129 RepID=A0AAN5IF44_9BILA|nr:hypothetical protein PMAYCL1PPCAC_30646 [Pristionchus mayeri]
MEEVSTTVRCSFCIRDLSKVTRVACAECPAVLCVKCFQLGSESGKHKRGHNYEFFDTEDKDTLFNRQWGREDEQNLIQTVHRYKLGNWDEVTQVISKGGRKRVVADVSRHFQLYFVQSTLGRTAMKEKEWIERRDLFKDDISKVISDPSGRELYYHGVIEALRNVKELPDLNDEDVVQKIDQVVRDYFASHNRTERKRKASELGAVLSKSRPHTRKEVFPYGESDDDAWWERIFKEPSEKKEVDRYYEENSVCMEEKCMAEAVEIGDMAQIMKMMKDAGIEDHESLGEELKALRLETFGEKLPVAEEKKSHVGAPAREVYTFKSRLDNAEPQTKRAKMSVLESSTRPLLPVDLKQNILVEAVIDDEEAVKQLEGKTFFEATLRNGESEDSEATQETSCDEADEVVDDGEEDSEVSSATDSDSDASHAAVFDYEAYEAKMRAAGYATDELYSDWDEESKEEISATLRQLAQRGALVDSSEDADDEEEEEEEGRRSKTRDDSMEGAEEDSPMEDDDAPCGSSGARKYSSELCGLESEASEEDDEVEDVESMESELNFSDDDDAEDSPTTSTSSLAVSDCESETERLDTLFGAPAMHVPKAMRKEKKKPKRVIKFYELGSDDEYHTMDEDATALPMAEMTVGESRKRTIARKLRAQAEKYYDRSPKSGRFVAKIPRPSMSPELAEEVHKYTHYEFDRVMRAGHVTPPTASPTPTAESLDDSEDKDRTPEARFGDDFESGLEACFSMTEEGPVHADHPAFQKYIMERLVNESDGGSECSSDECHSMSSETGQQLLEELGYPLTVEGQENEDVFEDAVEAPEGEKDDNDGQRGGDRTVNIKQEPIDEGETTRRWNGRAIKKEIPDSNDNVATPHDAPEGGDREIKEEEPEEQAQAAAAKSQPSGSFEPLRVKTEPCQISPKEEPVDDTEQQKKTAEAAKPPEERMKTVKREKHTESPKERETPAEEEEQMEEEDSEGTLYKLAEGNNDDMMDGEEELDVAAEEVVVTTEGDDDNHVETSDTPAGDEEEEEEEGEKSNNDDEDFGCVREEGIGMRCACQACTKERWTETLGEKEHELWKQIKKSGLSLEEVKEKLRRHFVDDSESSDSPDCSVIDEDEPEEVYVDAVQLNDTDWKLNLNSMNLPIPVKRASYRSADVQGSGRFSDGEHLSPPSAAEEVEEKMVVEAEAPEDEDEKMEVVDESSDRPTSSTKTLDSAAATNEASLCGLEEEKEEEEEGEDEEDEEDDKDKTPPMLSGDDKKGDDESAPEEIPRPPVLVIKKVHARGRTNLRVETRPRTPQDEKKNEEKEEEEVEDKPSPAKKKKISREFKLLFKDLEIRKWEESQAKNLKERATKLGEKASRGGVAVAVSDSETDHPDPRKKKVKGSESEIDRSVPPTPMKKNVKGGRNYVKISDRPASWKNASAVADSPPVDEVPRSSRRDSNAKKIRRKSSGSPKKSKKESKKKGTKRAAEPEESERDEQSSGEEEETNGGDPKSPSKKRRKTKRISMSKKERKAKWNKKIQNRMAREEKQVEEKKAVVSNIQFFQQHEITFFSNVFRRIPFDYEDHGFRNRVNFKSWVNDIYNMGYNQDRDDFDFEYFNDAEQIVSRLNITNCEGGMPIDLENEIKLAKVDRYLRVLQERRALRNQAAEYESVPDFLQLCRKMNSERRKLKDIIRSKPEEEKFDNKLSSVLTRDEVLEMKLAKQRLLKIRSRTDKLKELHAAGATTLDGYESVARFKPRTKFGRSEEQKKVDDRERGTLLQFDEKIACQLERLSLVAGHSGDREEAESSTV